MGMNAYVCVCTYMYERKFTRIMSDKRLVHMLL